MVKKSNHNIKKSTSTLITLADPSSLISEQFKTLRTNIQFAMVDKKNEISGYNFCCTQCW